MALLLGEAENDGIDYGSGATIDDPTLSTVVFIVYPTDLSNAVRYIANKGTPLEVFKRGTDGTIWRGQRNRSSGQLRADITGMTANEWQYIAWSWDRNTPVATSFRGVLGSNPVEVSANQANGSGSFNSDAASNLRVGSRSGQSDAVGARLAAVWYFDRILTLSEHAILWREPWRRMGAVLYTPVGLQFGTSTHVDLSGNGNNGTPSGLSLVEHAPVRVRRPIILLGAPPAGTTSVFRDASLQWHVRDEAEVDAPILWDVHAEVSEDAPVAWNVLAGVSHDVTLEWHVESALTAVFHDAALAWHVAQAVSHDAPLAWNVIASVLRDASVQWNVLASVERDAGAAWHVLLAVSRDAPSQWHVIAGIQRDAVLRWNTLSDLVVTPLDIVILTSYLTRTAVLSSAFTRTIVTESDL
jgi:hypothetical protein